MISRYTPRMKIIVILRNPVERAYSHWVIVHKRGSANYGFAAGLWREAVLALKGRRDPAASFFRRGRYHWQIKNLFDEFGPERCLVLFNKDLKHNHMETLTRIYDFLEIDKVPPPEPEVVHKNTYAKMPLIWRYALTVLYRNDVKKLERLLRYSVSTWQSPNGSAPLASARPGRVF